MAAISGKVKRGVRAGQIPSRDSVELMGSPLMHQYRNPAVSNFGTKPFKLQIL